MRRERHRIAHVKWAAEEKGFLRRWVIVSSGNSLFSQQRRAEMWTELRMWRGELRKDGHDTSLSLSLAIKALLSQIDSSLFCIVHRLKFWWLLIIAESIEFLAGGYQIWIIFPNIFSWIIKVISFLFPILGIWNPISCECYLSYVSPNFSSV